MTDYTSTATAFVPKHYQMDPETEDVLINGSELLPGMIVLIGSDIMRMHIGDPADAINYDQAMRWNRWFKVVSVDFTHVAGFGTLVSIVGEYEDGVKMHHRVDTTMGWYVKKDSIPREPIETTHVGSHRKTKQGWLRNYGYFLIGTSAGIVTAATGLFYLWWQIIQELTPRCM